ncbi:MAG TPA: hypothetical protein VK826_08030 [Bacteroidia bacterium]|nr:hypothetical protein [Bacteroidia bacterium]
MKNFITAKLVLVLLAFGTVAFVAESCGSNKHACGTKHQKRQRHKRIKKNTTFMSGFQAVETTTTK